MICFTLYPRENLSDTWLFYESDTDGRLSVRSRYRDLMCRTCGKVDEQAAVARGIGEGFVVQPASDWIGTTDDWICVSERFREHVESMGYGGLVFLPLNSNGYYLLTCDNLVQTDEVLAGFDNRNLCSECGRYAERLVGPFLQGMSLPESEETFFAAAIANESIKASYRPIFCSGKICRTLEAAQITGIDYVESI